MTTSIRTRILETLAQKKALSAAALSAALGITPAGIRHHLRRLESDGLVEEVPVGSGRPSAGFAPGQASKKRGRPGANYRLSDRGSGMTYLAQALLAALADHPEQESAWPALAAAALAGAAVPGRSESIAAILGRAVQRLNELGYQSRWEAHAAGPRLLLGRCPYHAIIAQHPELCQLDAALLARLSGRSVQQMTKLALNLQGLPVCVFRLGS